MIIIYLKGIDEMVAQRERLMKIIERCRKRERLDEKLDPFLTRWGMPELSSTFALDDPESVASFVASSASQGQTSDNFNFNPKKIEHKMSCDCNPCLCAVQERMEDQLPDGVNVRKINKRIFNYRFSSGGVLSFYCGFIYLHRLSINSHFWKDSG